MAEQFLNRAQIGTAPQQMGGEGMAQRMRRGMLGQPRQPPIIAHGFLGDGRVQPLAAGAEEERFVRRGIGPMRQPFRHGRAHRWQHRHQPRLAPLAQHPQRRILTEARRIWYWKGAASLSQLATDGTSAPSECKFPAPVARVTVLEAIEIIDVTDAARKSIEGVPTWRA